MEFCYAYSLFAYSNISFFTRLNPEEFPLGYTLLCDIVYKLPRYERVCWFFFMQREKDRNLMIIYKMWWINLDSIINV